MTILSGSCGSGTGCTGCTGCTGGLTSLRTLTAAVSGLSPPKKLNNMQLPALSIFFPQTRSLSGFHFLAFSFFPFRLLTAAQLRLGH